MASVPLGNFYGTAIVGAIDRYCVKYGPAAAHGVIARLPPNMRQYVQPNTPTMGILGAKKYPYPFIGELFRCMIAVIRAPDEDAFIREYASFGIDATLDTVARVVLRYLVSPAVVAKRAQELWNVFHDSGRVTISELTPNGYVSTLTEWPNHDVIVCKICMEARRRVVERTGAKKVEVRREKCLAWGHDCCSFRLRWE